MHVSHILTVSVCLVFHLSGYLMLDPAVMWRALVVQTHHGASRLLCTFPSYTADRRWPGTDGHTFQLFPSTHHCLWALHASLHNPAICPVCRERSRWNTPITRALACLESHGEEKIHLPLEPHVSMSMPRTCVRRHPKASLYYPHNSCLPCPRAVHQASWW